MRLQHNEGVIPICLEIGHMFLAALFPQSILLQSPSPLRLDGMLVKQCNWGSQIEWSVLRFEQIRFPPTESFFLYFVPSKQMGQPLS